MARAERRLLQSERAKRGETNYEYVFALPSLTAQRVLPATMAQVEAHPVMAGRVMPSAQCEGITRSDRRCTTTSDYEVSGVENRVK